MNEVIIINKTPKIIFLSSKKIKIKKIKDIIKPCLIALLDEINSGQENRDKIKKTIKKKFESKFWILKKYFKIYEEDKAIKNGTKKFLTLYHIWLK